MAGDWWPVGRAEDLDALHRATLGLSQTSGAENASGVDLLQRAAAADGVLTTSTEGPDLALQRATAAREAGLHWIAAFPVRAEDRLAAAVELFSSSEAAPGSASLELLEFARALLDGVAARERARAAVRRAAAHVRQRDGQLVPVAARLQEVEARYELLCRGSGEGLWDWDLVTDRIRLSTAAWSMVGRVADTPDWEAARWLERVHPDDRSRLDIELFEHMDRQSPHLESAYRVRQEDGSWRWVRMRGLALRDANGRPVRLAGSLTDITEERTAGARDFRDLFYHPLSKLPTRSLLLDRLEQAIGRRSRGPENSFTVLNLGIHDFRETVNGLEPGAADELLATAAARISTIVRPGDTVAHVGDGEFGILLEEIELPEDVMRIGRRTWEAIRQPIPLEGAEVVLGASVGAVIGSTSYERPEHLLRDAALAMRRGRRHGAEVQLFDHSAALRSGGVDGLGREFGAAFQEDALRLEYQPIVELHDGRITGLEALLRWDHPAHGRIPPYAFLPLAEEQGLMEEVTYWVLDRACRQMARWDDRLALRFRPTIAVNISERQLHIEGFVERAVEVVAATGLDPARVRFDISEGALTRDVRRATGVLEALKERGILAAIDDFGTGHLSLLSLHRFPVGVIKIDRSLVSGAGARADDWYLARTIVELARTLELDVIAEGIETREQLQRLRAIGCRQGQGFFFSGPVPPEIAERLIRDGYPLDLRAPIR